MSSSEKLAGVEFKRFLESIVETIWSPIKDMRKVKKKKNKKKKNRKKLNPKFPA